MGVKKQAYFFWQKGEARRSDWAEAWFNAYTLGRVCVKEGEWHESGETEIQLPFTHYPCDFRQLTLPH